MVMCMNNFDEVKSIYTPKIISNNLVEKITENAKVLIKKYEVRKNYFEDVILEISGQEILLGRFDQDVNLLFAMYKDGKILIGHKTFIDEVKDMKIVEIDALYEMADDTFYSCTEEEALKLFDDNIDTSYLKHKDKYIYRSDIEKKSRLK